MPASAGQNGFDGQGHALFTFLLLNSTQRLKNKPMIQNTYSELPERFYESVKPETFQSPKLLAFNKSLAKELGLPEYSDDELAQFFSGQKTLEGSKPLAQAYAGYQFGHPNPQLGDGRAHLLGEMNGYDIQLKGSGRTKFSRQGDGRSALGPVIREYIVSEAMHKLSVPTTRALAAVRTGEEVARQFGSEPGGIFTRVASSHIRVGTFQFFHFQDDREGVETLLNYTLERHYPEIAKLTDTAEKVIQFLKAVSRKQAELIAKWTALGFIHGVMNTDNYSVAGITIDYGPCAFMEKFEMHKTFSSIDHAGRYSYWNQAPIAQWNLLRLADCLVPLVNEDTDKAVAQMSEELEPAFKDFEKLRLEALIEKLGLNGGITKDNGDLIERFMKYLEAEKVDFTLAFRNLPKLYNGDDSFYPDSPLFNIFVDEWKKQNPDVESLNQINPLFIPRNHLVQRAIDQSYKGKDELFHKLNKALEKPYEEQPEFEEFTRPASADEAVKETFCGT